MMLYPYYSIIQKAVFILDARSRSFRLQYPYTARDIFCDRHSLLTKPVKFDGSQKLLVEGAQRKPQLVIVGKLSNRIVK